jgi:hypothetical protein
MRQPPSRFATMSLVVSSAPSYASLDEGRAFGATQSVTADQSDDALDVGVDTINATGTYFGAPLASGIVVNEVRTPLIVLPTPVRRGHCSPGQRIGPGFGLVSAHGLGIRGIPIELLDVDGFPRWQTNRTGTDRLRRPALGRTALGRTALGRTAPRRTALRRTANRVGDPGYTDVRLEVAEPPSCLQHGRLCWWIAGVAMR